MLFSDNITNHSQIKSWLGKNIEVFKTKEFESVIKRQNYQKIQFDPNYTTQSQANSLIKYSNSFIGNQKNKINVYEDDLEDVFNSRTFCLYEDVEKLRNNGLAKGGSLDNAIVVKGDKVLNDGGLRNNLEFVNHKILDCMGDLYLSGYKIIGSLKCSQGGHSLTNKLLREVFKDKNNFSIFEIKEKSLPHTYINKSVLKSIA